MQMSDNNRFVSLALNSAHMKWGVWTGCKTALTRHRTNFQPAEKTFTADTVHTEPFNIFALFTRNFERPGVLIFLR